MKPQWILPLAAALLCNSAIPAAKAFEDPALALTGAKVYPSPAAAPIDDAILLIQNGLITAVGKRGKVKIPASAQAIDCTGKTIVAGFWNSHVHFEDGWDDAAHTAVPQLEGHLQQMLTRWGFTTVWDLGSLPSNTLALRQRIEAGEVRGPQILMAGDIFPLHGHPSYLPASMQLPEAATPEQATHMAEQYMKMGLDGMKLFTGAYMGDKPVINMDIAIVKAAADVAHAEGKPVFAHPQNHTGADNALAGGVDILAHTLPVADGFTQNELSQMLRQHTALIPTLTLWTTVTSDPAVIEQILGYGVGELKAYSSAGGVILFGTDVGFQTKYDTSREYEFMGRAMGWRDILASLTTNPSAYFKQPKKGKVEAGMAADLVVLDSDPAAGVTNLAKVAYTIRAGKVLYSASGKP
jgi:imidazolonepropionase-like amidohydrolase